MATATQLRKISRAKSPKASLVNGLGMALTGYAHHVEAHILAQVMHESGGLVHDREIWGPTAAQQRYEGRKDLGNTQKGDGSKYRGYGPIQVTGRANVTNFYKWAKSQNLNPPDFVAKPELIATAPWTGWSVIWYWEVGNPTRKPLTIYADQNNIEMITRRVNGGLNGYDDRLAYYDRAALVLLGYEPNELKKFQAAHGLSTTTGSGPLTRAALHRELVKKSAFFSDVRHVTASPVIETQVVEQEVPVPVPVTAPSQDAPWWKAKETWVPVIGSGATTVLGGLGGIPWQNLAILLLAGVFITGALLVLRRKDQKIVATQVAAINAASEV